MARRRRRRRGSTGNRVAALVLTVLVGGPAALWAVGIGLRWLDDHRWLAGSMVAAAGVVVLMARRVASARRRERFAALARVTVADGLTGRQFEHLVADLLRGHGFDAVHVVGGAGDGGRDVTAVDPAGRRTIVQCKRHKKTIGPAAVRELIGTARLHDADVALFVTTSGFSAQAHREAEIAGVVLVDREALGRWLELGDPPYDHTADGTSPRGTPQLRWLDAS